MTNLQKQIAKSQRILDKLAALRAARTRYKAENGVKAWDDFITALRAWDRA